MVDRILSARIDEQRDFREGGRLLWDKRRAKRINGELVFFACSIADRASEHQILPRPREPPVSMVREAGPSIRCDLGR